jgi:hypothetical protein
MESKLIHRRTSFLAFLLLVIFVLPLMADQKPSFFIGGKKLYVGMSMSEAVRLLSACCQLSPTIDPNIGRNASGGHFIFKKSENNSSILGAISFGDQKVTRVTKPLAEDVDVWSEDLVTFTRALKHALQDDVVDSERSARISVRHENISNAESDIISIVFPDGHGIELHVATLHTPDKETNKRDFVTADEILE